MPLDLDPEPLTVGDDEAKVADLRNVGSRKVDLVQDSMADREPHASGPERAADNVLGAARPGRRNAGIAEGVHVRPRDGTIGSRDPRVGSLAATNPCGSRTGAAIVPGDDHPDRVEAVETCMRGKGRTLYGRRQWLRGPGRAGCFARHPRRGRLGPVRTRRARTESR